MDYRDLNRIERAMWRIEDKDFNYSTNKRWLLLKQAQNLWYKEQAKEKYDIYMEKFKETSDFRFQKEAEELKKIFLGEQNER